MISHWVRRVSFTVVVLALSAGTPGGGRDGRASVAPGTAGADLEGTALLDVPGMAGGGRVGSTSPGAPSTAGVVRAGRSTGPSGTRGGGREGGLSTGAKRPGSCCRFILVAKRVACTAGSTCAVGSVAAESGLILAAKRAACTAGSICAVTCAGTGAIVPSGICA